MSAPRRQSRIAAMQILYLMDQNHEFSPGDAVEYFEKQFSEEKTEVDLFTRTLVLGVSGQAARLDEYIRTASENWRVERMTVVDRAILRLGAFELYHCDDIPKTVTIDEMIELAKQFGSESSPAFINGVLDRMARSLDRPEKAP